VENNYMEKNYMEKNYMEKNYMEKNCLNIKIVKYVIININPMTNALLAGFFKLFISIVLFPLSLLEIARNI
jgi:hypothetical protein